MKHSSIAVVVLVAILMQGTVAGSYAADIAMTPDAVTIVTAEKTVEAVPVFIAASDSKDSITSASAALLSPEEQNILALKESQTPDLMDQKAGGCRTSWSNLKQSYETNCYNPGGVALGWGIMGAVIGSFGGAVGAAEGAVAGAALGYLFVTTFFSD